MIDIKLEGEKPPAIDEKEILKNHKKNLDLFQEILPSLQLTGKDILTDPEHCRTSRYPRFLINRAMSQHLDCLAIAQIMNFYPDIPARQHYLMYLKTIRKGIRERVQWGKKLKDIEHNARIIASYNGVSIREARKSVDLYSPDQINTMEKQMDEGG